MNGRNILNSLSLSLSLSLVVYSVPLGEKPAPLGVGFFHREITTSLTP